MGWANDIRYAARTLGRSPGFTMVAIASLAIGIGAATLTFNLFDTVFWRPLPVSDSHTLVRFVTRNPIVGTRSQFPYQLYREWRDQSTTMEVVFAEAPRTAVLTGSGPPQVVNLRLPTPSFFSGLGVQAVHGRVLTLEDEQAAGETPPAVLRYGFWQNRFGGDPGVLGQTMTLSGVPVVIVGVMPAHFNGVAVDTAPDIWLPFSARTLLSRSTSPLPADRVGVLDLSGRLRPGVSLADADREARLIWRRTMEAYYPEVFQVNESTLAEMLQADVGLDPLRNGVSLLRERFGNAVGFLLAGGGLVLLMVVLNVASVALARNTKRRGELSVRLAVGAPRWTLVRQVAIELLMLVVPAAALGLVLAVSAAPVLLDALPPLRTPTTSQVPLVLDLGPDWRMWTFLGFVSALTLAWIALPSAMAAGRLDLSGTVRGERATHSVRGRRVLLVFETALSVVLLAGGVMLVRTLDRLTEVPTGFDEDRVATFTIAPELAGYSSEEAAALRARLIERTRSLPGVTAVSTSMIVPMRGSGIKITVAPTGERITPRDELAVSMNGVAPGYFETMGMNLIAGRDLTSADDIEAGPQPVVANQALIRRYFSNTDPIGETFGTGQPDVAQASYRIVGVVNNAKYRSLREPIQPTFYYLDETSSTLVVRTSSPPQSIVASVVRELEALDPALPVLEVHTLAEEVAASVAAERLLASLAAVVGMAAAILTAIGIFGLFAQVVTQRYRELSVRIALGASAGNIGLLIGREAATMIALGLGIGVSASLVGGRWIESLLYEITPQDPASLGSAALVVVLAGIGGVWIPARRAVRTDPARGLRAEN